MCLLSGQHVPLLGYMVMDSCHALTKVRELLQMATAELFFISISPINVFIGNIRVVIYRLHNI